MWIWSAYRSQSPSPAAGPSCLRQQLHVDPARAARIPPLASAPSTASSTPAMGASARTSPRPASPCSSLHASSRATSSFDILVDSGCAVSIPNCIASGWRGRLIVQVRHLQIQHIAGRQRRPHLFRLPVHVRLHQCGSSPNRYTVPCAPFTRQIAGSAATVPRCRSRSHTFAWRSLPRPRAAALARTPIPTRKPPPGPQTAPASSSSPSANASHHSTFNPAICWLQLRFARAAFPYP